MSDVGLSRSWAVFFLPISARIRFIFLLFLSFAISLLSFAQTRSIPQNRNFTASLKHFSVEDGLAYREVTSIYQDERGFMWFGTRRGLNRFDGYEFKTWTKNNVSLQIEDAEGYLWLTSEEYLRLKEIYLLHTETGELLSFPEKFGTQLPFEPGNIIIRFIKGPDGAVYFVDQKQFALISYHPLNGFKATPLEFQGPLQLISFSSPSTIWANVVNSINNEDSFKNTLVEIDLEGKTLRRYPHQGLLKVGNFFSIKGELWYYERSKSGQGRFFRIDKNRKQHALTFENLHLLEDFFPDPQNNGFLKLDYIGNARTILALRYGMAEIIDPEARIVLKLHESFPSLREDGVIGERGYFKDRDGRIWMGGDFGVYLLDVRETPFKKYLYTEPVSPKGINKGWSCRDIAEYEGDIYVATEGHGIQKLQGTETLTTDKDGKWSWSLLTSRSGELYAGGFPHFLHLNKERRHFEKIPAEGNSEIGVWAAFEDRNGQIWLGCSPGLMTLIPEENIIRPFSAYGPFREFEAAAVYDIREDHKGTIWLSTEKGLYILDPEKGITARFWSGGTGKDSIPATQIYHFHEDEEGIFWLATGGDGLIRWDRTKNQSRQFTTTEGLPNNVIYAVYEDDFGKLWLSSDYGIIQFDKETGRSRSFLPKDGITHKEFNRVSHYQAQDGTIYFGGLNGVTSFHPRDFQMLDTIPERPLQITEFSQFNGASNELEERTGELIETRRIVLRPDDRFFQLRFALLTYEEPDKVRYRYKIEGIDEDWTGEQAENLIRLSRLPFN